ncbi:hypothetical protein PRK78_006471 [Emydomyces testavorans]|uniref:Uncharacterized protein n=1 Tax=Emydomyces testavorans TaxID=2070801 RepID=A0AAF0DNJ4_9EURO|nr:hypothetical protein PRK78_006471 [Emydomyces testavorans]
MVMPQESTTSVFERSEKRSPRRLVSHQSYLYRNSAMDTYFRNLSETNLSSRRSCSPDSGNHPGWQLGNFANCRSSSRSSPNRNTAENIAERRASCPEIPNLDDLDSSSSSGSSLSPVPYAKSLSESRASTGTDTPYREGLPMRTLSTTQTTSIRPYQARRLRPISETGNKTPSLTEQRICHGHSGDRKDAMPHANSLVRATMSSPQEGKNPETNLIVKAIVGYGKDGKMVQISPGLINLVTSTLIDMDVQTERITSEARPRKRRDDGESFRRQLLKLRLQQNRNLTINFMTDSGIFLPPRSDYHPPRKRLWLPSSTKEGRVYCVPVRHEPEVMSSGALVVTVEPGIGRVYYIYNEAAGYLYEIPKSSLMQLLTEIQARIYTMPEQSTLLAPLRLLEI